MATTSANAKKAKPRGRPFEKGNKGGPGNPRAAQVEALRAEVIAFVTPHRVQSALQALYDIVLSRGEGSVAAAKLLFDRSMGKVPDAVEVSGPSGGPIRAEGVHAIPAATIRDAVVMLAELRLQREAKQVDPRDPSPGAGGVPRG